MRIFLGGTCNGSEWREALIPELQVEYFDPVVEDWTPECMAEEIRQRETCEVCLYVITPKIGGVYSIAEAVDDSNKRPEKVVFACLPEDGGNTFTKAQEKSLTAVGNLIRRNGGTVLNSLKEIADYCNKTQ